MSEIIQASARRRQKAKRQRDFLECLPATRDVDRAFVAAIAEVLREKHNGSAGRAFRAKSELGAVIHRTLQILDVQGFDVRNRTCTARVLHRIGDETEDDWLRRSQL